MKKVLYIFDALNRGGAEISTLQISAMMKNWTPVILSIFKGTELKKDFEDKGIKVYCLNKKHRFAIIKIRKEIQRIIDIEKPDILHSNLFVADQFSRWLGPKNNIPVINSFINDSYSPERKELLSIKERFTLDVYKLIDRLLAPRVTQFMSLTKAIIYNNSNALKIDTAKVKVISRGRNLEELHQKVDEKKVSEIKKQYGPGTIILTVSRLLIRKGYIEAIKALKIVIDVYPETKYLIAGGGHDHDKLEGLIAGLNLEKNIILLGSRIDIPTLLEASDIFLFPSHYEGQGGALIEAMFMEKKIIASRIPVIEESLTDNYSAKLFNYRDIIDLSDKIIWAMENPIKMQQFAHNAKLVAEKRFKVEKIVKEYENFYDEVLQFHKSN